MKPLLVIDMSALLHRAYHGATRGNADYWTNQTKHRAINWILGWVRTAKSKHNANVACAFDGDKSFRTVLLPTYKISRGGGPDADLNGKPCYEIMDAVIEECKMNGYATGWYSGFEGDDVIAHFTTSEIANGGNVIVWSKDKDMRVLSHPGRVSFINDEKEDTPQYADPDNGRNNGYDFTVLTGDRVDDIPGVVTPAPARKLIARPVYEWFPELDKEKQQKVLLNVSVMSLRRLSSDPIKQSKIIMPPEWANMIWGKQHRSIWIKELCDD